MVSWILSFGFHSNIARLLLGERGGFNGESGPPWDHGGCTVPVEIFPEVSTHPRQIRFWIPVRPYLSQALV